MSTDDTLSGVSRRAVLGATASAAGAAVALPAVAAQAPDFGGWLADTSNYDGVTDATGQEEVRVTVGAQGNGGNFAFGPPAISVDPGTTVIWEWNGKGGQHNVHAMEGADFESDLTAEAGATFEHTFDSEGVVKYQCDPHASLGMKGAVAVGDVETTGGGGDGGGGGEAGGGDGGRPFTPPGGTFGATFMLFLLGSAAVAAVAVLGGELYHAVRTGGTATSAEEAAGGTEIDREIGHDEFDPVGTASLIVVYFLILVVLWVFVYFVEFLGNGPTVTG